MAYSVKEHWVSKTQRKGARFRVHSNDRRLSVLGVNFVTANEGSYK